jgi:mRNA interferase MazF
VDVAHAPGWYELGQLGDEIRGVPQTGVLLEVGVVVGVVEDLSAGLVVGELLHSTENPECLQHKRVSANCCVISGGVLDLPDEKILLIGSSIARTVLRQKRRPALVLSSSAFQKANGALVLAMITSAERSSLKFDAALANWRMAGLKKPCVIRMKLFTLDAALIRGLRGHLSDRDRGVVRERFVEVFPFEK